MVRDNEIPVGYVIIYRPWIRDPRTGKRRYPVNRKVFKLVVRNRSRN
jgi:hypothetical protein